MISSSPVRNQNKTVSASGLGGIPLKRITVARTDQKNRVIGSSGHRVIGHTDRAALRWPSFSVRISKFCRDIFNELFHVSQFFWTSVPDFNRNSYVQSKWLHALILLAVACGLWPVACPAQTAPQPGSFDYTGKTFTFLLTPPPTAVPITQISASGLDNPGPCTYYYWLVARFTIGNLAPTGPITIINASCTLTRGNQISWTGVNNATGYDVLRTTTPTPPSGTANIAVGTNVAGPVIDTGGALSSYTVATVDPASFNCEMDNEPTGPGTSKLTVHPTPCGFGVPSGTCILPGGPRNLVYDNNGVCADANVVYTGPINLQISAGPGAYHTNPLVLYDFDLNVGLAGSERLALGDGDSGNPISDANRVVFQMFGPGILGNGIYIFTQDTRTQDRAFLLQMSPVAGGGTSNTFALFNAVTPGDNNAYGTLEDLLLDCSVTGSDTAAACKPLDIEPSTGSINNVVAATIGPVFGASVQGIQVWLSDGSAQPTGFWNIYQQGSENGTKNNFDAQTRFNYATPSRCARFDANNILQPAAGDCASGAGTGTVTSVGLALPASLFTVSGSPVTTSGTLTGAFGSIGAHLYLGNNTGSATTAALVQPQYSDLGGGIPANGSNWKHQSVTTGSIIAGGATTVTLTWTTAFLDNSYDPYCSVFEITGTTSTLRLHHVSSILAASVTAVIVNDDGTNPHTGTLYCQGIHP